MDTIRSRLACPTCKTPLGETAANTLQCVQCGVQYPVFDGVPILHPPGTRTQSEGDALWLRHDTLEKTAQRNPLLRLARFPNPAIRSDLPRETKKIFEREVMHGSGLILNIGSGIKKLYRNPNIVNLDISHHENVDVVGDGLSNPFLDDTFDGAVLDSVIEHVPDPRLMAKETWRVLKPGGFALVHAPFIFPYHGAPRDYFRFTDEGLRAVFRDFEEIECECDHLPGRALQEILRAYAGIFSDKRAVAFGFRFLTAWLSVPLKMADRYLMHKKKSHEVVAGFSFLGKKPKADPQPKGSS